MRVVFILELILATAVGLGCARAAYPALIAPPDVQVGGIFGFPSEPPERDHFDDALTLFGAYFLPGFAVVASLGLWGERIRRRSPLPWRIGRWTCSFVGLFALTMSLKASIEFATECLAFMHWRREPFAVYYTTTWLYDYRLVGPILLAAWITLCLAGVPRNSRPDAREWVGRFIGILALVEWSARQVWTVWLAVR